MWLKSDLTLPEGLYAALSLYLLFAIGFKGGVELSHTSARAIALPALATLLLGLLTPAVAYFAARRFLRLDGVNAAALAAHYGSVSAVTFLAALAFVQASGHKAEGFMPTLVALLEVPGVIIGILLARRSSSGGRLGEAFREVLTGKSVFLMVGGLLVGVLSGEEGMKKVEAFFVAPFQGVLTLFLLELGLVAARRLADLRRLGWRLVAFGTAVPLLHGSLGLMLAKGAGLSLGVGWCWPPWPPALPISPLRQRCAWPCPRPIPRCIWRLPWGSPFPLIWCWGSRCTTRWPTGFGGEVWNWCA